MSSIRRSIQALDLLARKGPLGVRAVAQQLGAAARLGAPAAARPRRGRRRRAHAGRRVGAVLPAARDHRPAARPPAVLRGSRIPSPSGSPRRRARPSTSTRSSGMAGVCIDKVRGNEGMQLDLRIGSRGPLHLRRRRQGDAGIHDRGRPASRSSTVRSRRYTPRRSPTRSCCATSSSASASAAIRSTTRKW